MVWVRMNSRRPFKLPVVSPFSALSPSSRSPPGHGLSISHVMIQGAASPSDGTDRADGGSEADGGSGGELGGGEIWRGGTGR
jgi:hypothetical protein